MRFGVCAPIEQAGLVHQAGFDFIECTVVSLKPEESDDSFRETLRLFQESPVPVEAFNVLLPGTMKVVGESVDYEAIRRYLDKAVERILAVGGQTVVFGSGKARRVPEGFARERAKEQLERFLHLVADCTDRTGITVVIEPLNRSESNIVNSVPEAYDLAKRVNRPSIQILADFYHMEREGETLENIVTCQELIRHLHVADSDRLAPGTGQYPYDVFVDCVKRIGYDSRISVECRWKEIETEIVDSGAYLRRIFQ